MLAALVVGGVALAVLLDRARARPASVLSRSGLAGSKSTTSGRILVRRKWSGQLVPSAASFSRSFEPTNSSTAGWSSKWPTLRSPAEIMPRIAGISRAAMARRSAAGKRLARLAAESRLARGLALEPFDGAVDDADRRLVAFLRRVAPGEQAVAFQHDAGRLRVVAAEFLQPQAELEARPLPRQPADLAAEDPCRQLLAVLGCGNRDDRVGMHVVDMLLAARRHAAACRSRRRAD